MPELPEVDAITGVIARHCIGQQVMSVDVIRQPTGHPYFGGSFPIGQNIVSVHRRGKHVLLELSGAESSWVDCHNAMTGYWDYEDDPWTFDYVEGPRDPGDHVRMTMDLSNGHRLRFHDTRLFGRISIVASSDIPKIGPELMQTPNGPDAPVISLREFAVSLLKDSRPVKSILMDQSVIAGIGNIYSSEGCHLAGVDPHIPGKELRPSYIPILLEALRCVVAHCIPKVQYQWLKVYRRDLCGSCDGLITRTELDKRATFMCNNCQGEI